MDDIIDKFIAANTDENPTKSALLKWIFTNARFRYNDKLTAFLNELKKDKNYTQLELINTLFLLIRDNTLENVAALDCVRIIIDKQ